MKSSPLNPSRPLSNQQGASSSAGKKPGHQPTAEESRTNDAFVKALREKELLKSSKISLRKELAIGKVNKAILSNASGSIEAGPIDRQQTEERQGNDKMRDVFSRVVPLDEKEDVIKPPPAPKPPDPYEMSLLHRLNVTKFNVVEEEDNDETLGGPVPADDSEPTKGLGGSRVREDV